MFSNRPNWYPLIDYLLIDSSKIIAQNLQLFAINKCKISNNLAFSDILRKNVDPLYVDPLLNSIPLGKTIDFTLDEVYIQKKLDPFCKKSRNVSKKLLNEL